MTPPDGCGSRSAARRCSDSLLSARVGHRLGGDAVVGEQGLVQLVPPAELIDREQVLDRRVSVRGVALLRELRVGRAEEPGVGVVTLGFLRVQEVDERVRQIGYAMI